MPGGGYETPNKIRLVVAIDTETDYEVSSFSSREICI